MTEEAGAPAGRNARRKTRTRAALIQAAREILAEGGDVGVSIQTIADRADVGFGSFYNHFASKAELFQATFDDSFEQYTAWREAQLPAGIDPVGRFAMNIRLTGRLAALRPDLTRVLTHRLAMSTRAGLDMTPGLSADFLAAIRAVRAGQALTCADSEVTVVALSGAMAAALQMLIQREPAEHARIADSLTADMLRMLGADETLVAELLAAPCPPTSGASAQPAPA